MKKKIVSFLIITVIFISILPMNFIGGKPDPNEAPKVDVGKDQTIYLHETAVINAEITDDGLPELGDMFWRWKKNSGPGTVTFESRILQDTKKLIILQTTVNFSEAGIYILELWAFDGALSASDTVKITVNKLEAGFTPGSFAVSPTGAAIYSIPISVPPGTAGLKPELSISYNSQGTNGILGDCWSLGGLSSIQRVPKTIAQDEEVGAVQLDDNDQLSLDGKRLILVEGRHWRINPKYTTEIEEFLEITAKNDSGYLSHFIVRKKSGEILHYGLTENSRLIDQRAGYHKVLVWYLSRIEDRLGNYIDFEYIYSNGVVYPSIIKYTGNANKGLIPYASIVFIYETRPDILTRYLPTSINNPGQIAEVTKRLKSIKIYLNSEEIRNYNIRYFVDSLSGIPISRIVSIQECVNKFSYLPPIIFNWNYAGSNNFRYPYKINDDVNLEYVLVYSVSDVNGDGYGDIVRFKTDGVYVSFSNGTGLSKAVKILDAFGYYAGGWRYYKHPRMLGDVNGDGMADIVGFGNDGVFVSYSTGNGFTPPDLKIKAFGANTGDDPGNPFDDWWDQRDVPRMLADANGDGRSDIIGFWVDGVYVSYSIGDTFTFPIRMINDFAPAAGGWWWDKHPRTLADVNGDGMTDIVGFGSSGVHVSYSTGNNYTKPVRLLKNFGISSGGWDVNKHPRMLGDLNGDKKADIVGFGDNGVYVSYSTGYGFTEPVLMIQDFGYNQGWQHNIDNYQNRHPRMLVDINRDGLTDILGFGSSGVWVSFSTSAGFSEPKKMLNYFGSSNSAGNWFDQFYEPRRLTDVNGDGFLDIIGIKAMDDITCFSENLHKKLNIYSIRHGLGKQIKIDYLPLTDSMVYVNESKYSLYPNVCINPAIYLVSNVSTNDGIGGESKLRYKYYNLQANLHGRGFLGFSKIEVNDTQTGILTTEIYDQTFPFTGLLTEKIVETLEGIIISKIMNTYDVKEYVYSEKRKVSKDMYIIIRNWKNYFIFLTKTRTISRELDGTNLKCIETSYNNYDNFGNVESITVKNSELENGWKKASVIWTSNSDENFLDVCIYGSTSFSGEAWFKDITLETVSTPLNQWEIYGDGDEYNIDGNTLYFRRDQITKQFFGFLQVSIPCIPNTLYRLSASVKTKIDSGHIGIALGNWDSNPEKNTHKEYCYSGINASTTLKIDTKNFYDNYPNSWILGRLYRSEATYYPTVSSGESSITRTSEFSYYSNGLIKEEIIEPDSSELSLSTSYRYDDFGNIINETVSGYGFLPRTQLTVYDPKGRFPNCTINALGYKTCYEYDECLGELKKIIDPNSHITIYDYDNLGRFIYERNSDNTESNITYEWCQGDTESPPLAVYKVTVDSPGNPKVVKYYDMFDRIVRTKTIGQFGKIIYEDIAYDKFGNIANNSLPYFKEDWDKKKITAYSYDILGRTTSITTPDNIVTSIEYKGFKTIETNKRGYKTEIVKNIADQIVSVKDARNKIITYEYDAIGNLIETTDPADNKIIIKYDIRGFKRNMSDPDKGFWEYKYNAMGELIWQKDAKGQETTIKYDKLGRKTSIIEPEGETRWVYDYGNGNIGKLCSVWENFKRQGDYWFSFDGVTGYEYDNYGRLSRETRLTDNMVYLTEYTYDSYSRVETVKYPHGLSGTPNFTIRYIYDTFGYLKEIRNADTFKLYWKAVETDAQGKITQENFGDNIKSYWYYDELGKLERILTEAIETDIKDIENNGIKQARGGDEIKIKLQDLQYQFDSMGNLKRREDKIQNLKEDFLYDELNRLKHVYTYESNSLINHKFYNYDDIGNIIYKSDVGLYTYDSLPHAVKNAGGETYNYDANGNMITGAGRIINYTSFNKPSQIKISEDYIVNYSYNFARKRITEESPLGKITYIGNLYEKVEKPNGDVEHRYFITDGSRDIAFINYTYRDGTYLQEQVSYLLRDHIGSIDTIIDEAGNILMKFSYDAFGKRRLANWRDAPDPIIPEFPHGFSGHKHDDEIGLINMIGRMYDPILGRFISPDEFIQEPGNLQTLNRYSYVLNNPLSLTDPTGYKSWKDTGKIILTIAGAFIAAYASAYIAATLGAGEFATTLIAGAVGGFTGGLINGGNIESALIGAAQGLAYAYVGSSKLFKTLGPVVRIAAHGLIAGCGSLLRGGDATDFNRAFAAGSLTKLTHNAIASVFNGRSMENLIFGAMFVATVGGTVSELFGGNYANGAVTAAFAYLYNKQGKKLSNAVRSAARNKLIIKLQDKVGVELYVSVSLGGYGAEANLEVSFDEEGKVQLDENFWIGHEMIHVCKDGTIEFELEIGGAAGFGGTFGIYGEYNPFTGDYALGLSGGVFYGIKLSMGAPIAECGAGIKIKTEIVRSTLIIPQDAWAYLLLPYTATYLIIKSFIRDFNKKVL